MDYQKEKMVSFLLPTQILETIDDISYQDDNLHVLLLSGNWLIVG